MSENWITWHGYIHVVPQEYEDLRAVLNAYVSAHPGSDLPPLGLTLVVRNPGPRPELPEAPLPKPPSCGTLCHSGYDTCRAPGSPAQPHRLGGGVRAD